MNKKQISHVPKYKPRFAKTLFFLVVFLSLFGLLAVYNSSSSLAINEFGDKYYFLKEQFKWLLMGFTLFFWCTKISYDKWYSISLILLLVTIILLITLFVPGLGIAVKGARRWLFFGGQPSELAKLSLVIYLAAWFSNKEKERLWAFLILSGIILGLIILQPDLGTAVVIGAIAFILYFLSGASLKHFFVLLPFIPLIIFVLIKIAPYRLARLTTFLDNSIDPLGKSYHIRQILIALGSGGLWGVGLGKSRQKFAYIPESSTDSIFAIIAEEIGFIGSLFLVFLFIYLIYKGFKIAKNAPDNFGKLLAAGIASWLAVQVIINLSAMVALLPLTGIPLPFISYGGSSLLVSLAAMGILINIDSKSKNR